MAKVGFIPWLIQLFLTAGTTLLLVFIVLSGSVDHFPFNRFYWIEADTSNISGAPDISRWTFWGLASKDGKVSVKFESGPAYPFSPVDNFDTTVNVPQDFIDNRNVYFYLSRFAFAFFWIALAFVGVSLLLSIFSVASYSIIKINGWLTTVALLFTAGAVSFETAVSVLGKNAFHDNDLYAHLGASLFGISWGAVAALIILFFIAWGELISASYRKHQEAIKAARAAEAQRDYSANQQVAQQSEQQFGEEAVLDNPYAQQKQGTLNNESGIKFFKIRRHNKDDAESV